VKINRYLAFLESGEILERYPDAQDRKVAILVVTRYEPDAEGLRFFERVSVVLAQAGFEFRRRQFQ
jgi:hypothetical protein